MRLTLSSLILKREVIMTHFTSSTDLMAMIGLNSPILSGIFLEVLTSIRFLRRWPEHSASKVLMKCSESLMARDIGLLNFGDRGSLVGDSYFLVLALEGDTLKRFRFLQRFSRGSWGNPSGIS